MEDPLLAVAAIAAPEKAGVLALGLVLVLVRHGDLLWITLYHDVRQPSNIKKDGAPRDELRGRSASARISDSAR